MSEYKIGDVVERRDKENLEHKHMVPGIVYHINIPYIEVAIDDQRRYQALWDDLELVGIPNVFDWINEELQP